MSFGGINGNGVAAYLASALPRSEQKAVSTDGTAAASRSARSATSALDAIAHSRKSLVTQAALSKQQTQLTSAVHTALVKAGLSLTGEVGFTLDASGAGQVSGSDEDRAVIASLLKADTSKPGLAQRVTDLVRSAAGFSASMRDSAAWVQAARSAGRNGDVLALYSSFSQAQDPSATTYRIDGQSGSLSYAGVVSSQA